MSRAKIKPAQPTSRPASRPSAKVRYPTPPEVHLETGELDDSSNESPRPLIVFVSEAAEPKNETDASAEWFGLPRWLDTQLDEISQRIPIHGGKGDVGCFILAGGKPVITIGLGSRDHRNQNLRREAGAAVVQALEHQKLSEADVALDSLEKKLEADALGELVEGIGLGSYRFSEFKTSGKNKTALKNLRLFSKKSVAKGREVIARAETLVESVLFARWLGDRPGNLMTPTILSEVTVGASKGTPLQVEIWNRARIEKERMASFLSVSLGSAEEPKFIVMRYSGASKNTKPIALVGKGLTFDSGGISIKPSAGMEEMKFDMCGGAAVIGTMLAVARLGLKANVIGFVPATENMPGPAANKPGDIVIARNGKSIEINNTDAEGRLILADALVYADEQDPACIIDLATLTGAIVVALGNTHTGYFTRHNDLAKKIEKASETSGEWVWRMPLTDFHGRDMKGTYADLSNTNSAGKGAGSATAAAFLENFVRKETPWAHLDVAGTAWQSGDRWSFMPKKGATGIMIRTLVSFIENWD